MLYITIQESNLLYRSRLGKNLDEITLDYVSSISDDTVIAQYDIIGSQAHVIMLKEKNIITKGEAKKILSALEFLKKEKFDKNNASEDIHELIEMLVIKKIGPASGGKMHTARSRNDQIALDTRMKIRDDISIICNCLLDTIEALVSQGKKHQKTIIPLYTHLQQAQVGTFSHYLLAQADSLFRDFERLSECYMRINRSPIGAGPIGGTSLPIDRQFTAKLLGFEGIVENSIDATSSRDFVAEYIASASILMTNLSRLSEDLIIWSSSEFNFIELADQFASPSSVMPQKKNPDILELTRGKTSEIIGNLMSILSTLKGLPTGYGRDLQQIKTGIWATSKTTISALIIIKSMILTITVNEKKMKRAAESGNLIALDVAEKLVQKNIPFRTAHTIVGRLVHVAHDSKKSLSNLNPSEIKKIARETKTDFKIISNILKTTTIATSLQDRVSQGSSGYSEQVRMIENRLEKINDYRTQMTKRDNKLAGSLGNLSELVRELIK